MENQEKYQGKSTHIRDKSRRKAVKKIAGGVTALVAYQALPAKWGTPIMEQVFLPAHAVTSGTAITLALTRNSGDTSSSSVVVTISGQLNPPEAGVPVNIAVTSTP